MQVGLTGPQTSGKTTLFELLSNAHGSFLSPDQANTAAVDVPDARVDALSALFKPVRTIYAKISFTDTNRLSPGDRANNNRSLTHLKLMDALAVVLDAYSPGRDGAALARDLEFCRSELALSDLESVEKKLEKVRKQNKPTVLAGMPELEVFEKLSAELMANRPLRGLDLPAAVWKELQSFSFLSVLPVFVVVNLSETHGAAGPAGLAEFEAAVRAQGLEVVRIYTKLEKDLQELSPEEREVFRAEYAFPLDGKSAFIRQAYTTTGLISFLTAGEDEVRAWTVRRGCPAQEAAAAIHKDLMNFFVRAEVVTCERLLEAGSEAEAVKRGWRRAEKKDYPVQDGDVITFLSSK